MPQELLEATTESSRPEERRFFGVAIAQVISNLDATGLGRVQLRLPWLPSFQPWARVAVPMAGLARGTWFIPQPGDEVLVAFNHGDVREPYVVGSLWNAQDQPPALLPTDAVDKRIIRTPLGHEVEFDDLTQSITITSTTQQKIKLDPTGIDVETTAGTAKISLDTAGNISIKGMLSIKLEAPKISIKGTTIDIKSDVATEINGGAVCNVQGGVVKIN